MTKEDLRQKLKAERSLLTLAQVDEKSRAIADIFAKNVGLDKVNTVHLYSSISSWKEVDTKFIAQKLSDKKIFFGDLSKNEVLPAEKFDLIIVPVLGFDKDLYRLGLGSGWYDRFLAAQPQALKIGLAYASAKAANLPHEPHDIRLDKIITEEGIIG